MSDGTSHKAHLRSKIRRALTAMPPQQAHAASVAICASLATMPEFAAADVVMLYLPITYEVDVVHAALEAWRADKVVVVPRVNWEHHHMTAVRIDSLDDEMIVGSYGLRQPARSEPWPVDGIDLIAVPGLAFDRCGRRLGRGGGFYDRFLAQPGLRAMAVGVAFAAQVVEAVPAEAHDRELDALVTQTELLRFCS